MLKLYPDAAKVYIHKGELFNVCLEDKGSSKDKDKNENENVETGVLPFSMLSDISKRLSDVCISKGQGKEGGYES